MGEESRILGVYCRHGPASLISWRMCWVHSMTGVWVYPLLEHIGPTARIFFFFCLMALINVYYVLGEILNNYIWDSSKCTLESDKTKSD